MEKTSIKPTRIRFRILALIFVCVVINYMDRTNISVAATAITDDLKLTPVQLGILFRLSDGPMRPYKFQVAFW
jgi:ACS family D-galactonate transporter-like MFS transporter